MQDQQRIITQQAIAHRNFKLKLARVPCANHLDQPARTFIIDSEKFLCKMCDVDFALAKLPRLSLQNEFDGKQVYQFFKLLHSNIQEGIALLSGDLISSLDELQNKIEQVISRIRARREQAEIKVRDYVYQESYLKVKKLLDLKQEYMCQKINENVLCKEFAALISTCSLAPSKNFLNEIKSRSFYQTYDKIVQQINTLQQQIPFDQSVVQTFIHEISLKLGKPQPVRKSGRVKAETVLVSLGQKSQPFSSFLMQQTKTLFIGDLGQRSLIECDLRTLNRKKAIKGVQITAILCDQEKRLLLVQQNNHRVSQFNPVTGVTNIIVGTGLPASTLNCLREPTGLYLQQNYYYIADSGNHRILRVSKKSRQVTMMAGTGQAGSGVSHLNFPTWVIVKENHMIICDYNNDRIVQWKIGMSIGALFIKKCEGIPLSKPFSIVKANSWLVFTDQFNHRLIITNSKGDKCQSYCLQGKDPRGISVLSGGELIVCQQTSSRILKMTLIG